MYSAEREREERVLRPLYKFTRRMLHAIRGNETRENENRGASKKLRAIRLTMLM